MQSKKFFSVLLTGAIMVGLVPVHASNTTEAIPIREYLFEETDLSGIDAAFSGGASLTQSDELNSRVLYLDGGNGTYKFTYDGKDYRWLSTSERIKAGLEVAMLLKRLTGLIYPTFMDNAKSINTSFVQLEGQTIFAFVRKCALTVHEPSPATVKEAA